MEHKCFQKVGCIFLKNSYLVLILIFSSPTFAQDIISNPIITSGIIQLGEKGSVQFNISPKTLCDSYTVSYDVDYISKTININVNYIYNSICDDGFGFFTEFVDKQMLLSGVYFVNLNLNVVNNPQWNSQVALGAITVIPPSNNSCSSGFIPFLESFCPSGLLNQVCACDGVTYVNECVAYLDSQNGVYTNGTCPSYIYAHSDSYSCSTFYSSNYSNFFESYGCNSGAYVGAEIILAYDHNESSPQIIDFISSTNDVSLFLISLSNDLECLRISEQNKLELDNLQFGQYYIIVESNSGNEFSISFCEDPLNTIETKTSARISPNPAVDYIEVTSQDLKIVSVHILNSNGGNMGTYNIDAYHKNIEVDYSPGLYFVNVEYQNGEYEMKRILITNK